MNRNESILIRVVLAVVVVSSLGVAPAVADSNGVEIFGDDENDEDEESWSETVRSVTAYADGVVNRVAYGLRGDDSQSPSETMNNEADWVNSHSQELVEWYNSHYAAPASNQTYRVELSNDDDTAVRYLEVDSDGSNVTALRAVNSTDRPVDATLSLSGQWVSSLVDETKAFHSEYVENDTAVESDDAYVNRLKAQYAADTDGIREILS